MKKFKTFKKKSAIFWITIFLGIILFFQFFSTEFEKPAKELSYSEFTQKIKDDSLIQVTIKGKQTTAIDKQLNRLRDLEANELQTFNNLARKLKITHVRPRTKK